MRILQNDTPKRCVIIHMTYNLSTSYPDMITRNNRQRYTCLDTNKFLMKGWKPTLMLVQECNHD